MISEFVIAEGEKAKRLDAFLVSHERGVSRTGMQRLITSGRIRVNATIVKSSRKIKPGDRITIDQPEPGPMLVNNAPIPLHIIYEDHHLLVINKPAGVVSHPTSGYWHGTLLNGLLDHFQSNEETRRGCQMPSYPGLVHRLDKETSGVMVVAKTTDAHRELCSQFERRIVVRIYEAIVYGNLEPGNGAIHLPIGRDAVNRKRVSGRTSEPQPATTQYRVVQCFGRLASRVELIPFSGRQHQLRVHMASVGCPIMGDLRYGYEDSRLIQGKTVSRMMLHAQMLRFRHPISFRWEEFSIGCPSEMAGIMTALELQATQANKENGEDYGS